MPSQQWSAHASSAQYAADDQLAVFVGANRMPTSQIEMTISCRNLINTDVLSKSDPFCIISMKEPWQNKYYEIARTETIDDTLNPQWVKKILLSYNRYRKFIQNLFIYLFTGEEDFTFIQL